MRRVATLAMIAASLLWLDASCNGGVNPGQIHQHRHEGPLPVHCSAQVGPTCIGATPGPEVAAYVSRENHDDPHVQSVAVLGCRQLRMRHVGTFRRASASVSGVWEQPGPLRVQVQAESCYSCQPCINRSVQFLAGGQAIGGSVVPRSPESASAALAMKTAIGTLRPARKIVKAVRGVGSPPGSGYSCEGVNILIEPSMVRVGFPHHPGSQVEGKVRIVAGACPPTSGTVTAWLQRYSFPPLGSPPGTPGSWHTAAGPRSVSVAGIEAPRVIRFLDAVCRPHHWWRLRIHGEDITDGGVPTSFTRCWPGGGLTWKCFKGRQGRFYLNCG